MFFFSFGSKTTQPQYLGLRYLLPFWFWEGNWKWRNWKTRGKIEGMIGWGWFYFVLEPESSFWSREKWFFFFCFVIARLFVFLLSKNCLIVVLVLVWLKRLWIFESNIAIIMTSEFQKILSFGSYEEIKSFFKISSLENYFWKKKNSSSKWALFEGTSIKNESWK